MALYRRKDSPNYYVGIYHNGQRIKLPTGTANRAEAKRYHDKVIADLWRHAKLAIPIGHTWADAVKEWLKVRERGLEDRYRLNWIIAHLGDPDLSTITDPVISSLIRSKRDEGASPGTLQRYIGLIHAVLNGAKRAKWLMEMPAMPEVETPPWRVRWLTKREWQRLEPLLPLHLRQLARFALTTGLCRHNVTHLGWDRVNLERRVLWVSAEDMKQGDALGIPLNDDALAVLKEQQGVHADWVFPYNGKPVHLTSTKAWHRVLTTAGIEDFTWHDLRHTWASWHVMSGTRLEELQELGGWKTLEQVQRYAHLAPQHLAGVAGNVRPVDHAHS